MTILPKRMLRVAGPCVIATLLLLPQLARSAGSGPLETFKSICADTFPGFEAMGEKVEALGGSLEPSLDPIFSRVPYIEPNSAKSGSTDKAHANPLDDMGVDYAEGVALGLPAAGCSIMSRRTVDEAAISQLLDGFEAVFSLGYQKGTFIGGGPYRAWVVQLKGRRAVLTILQPWFFGKQTGVKVALIRLDEALINQLIASIKT